MSGPRFDLTVRVYYEDTDFSGVVYHARHLHFLERGRTEALREAGILHSELLTRAEPLVLAVRRLTIDWLAPARIDDLLTVSTTFEHVRGARIFLAQAIERGETVIAAAAVEAACMNLEGRPRRLPPELAARLEAGPA